MKNMTNIDTNGDDAITITEALKRLAEQKITPARQSFDAAVKKGKIRKAPESPDGKIRVCWASVVEYIEHGGFRPRGKPLLLTVLLPLVIGVVIKVYATRVADKIFPVVKKIAGISTLLLLGFVVFANWRVLLSTLGSFAIAGQVLFILGMAAPAYFIGFGLNQAQRSAMSLAVCSRNGSAMLMAVTAFPVIDPKLMAMALLAVPVPVIVWLVMASFLGSRAGKIARVDAN